jgi:hypothetical protein
MLVTFQAFTEYLMGDSMTTLNMVHRYAYDNDIKVKVNFNWPNSKDFLYHFEDTETAAERIDYIHQFYSRKDDVIISHTFNQPISKLLKSNHLLLNNEPCSWDKLDEGCLIIEPHWKFDEGFNLLNIPDKIIIWDYRENSETPKSWKTHVNCWDNIINILESYGDVNTLTYRTPIREAMWHINTAKLIVSYDGMWHYIARNLFKPHLVTSPGYFTRIHTPGAIMLKSNEEAVKHLMSIEDSEVFDRAIKYRNAQGYY